MDSCSDGLQGHDYETTTAFQSNVHYFQQNLSENSHPTE